MLAASMVAGAMLWGSASVQALARTTPGKMILFGSSSMNGIFGYLIAADFEQAGFDVTRKGVSAAGLARPDFRDLPQILGGFPIQRAASTTTSVLLYIGGNDGQSLWLRPEERTAQDVKPWVFWKDARWPGIYESRMVHLINGLCERGVEHAFVLPPADVVSDHLQKRLERVRELQQNAVKQTKCGRFIPTMGDQRSHFELNGEPLRSPDGVHMNRAGASQVWTRIRERVFTQLGRTAPVQDCERCMIARAVRRAHKLKDQQREGVQRSAAAGEAGAQRSAARGERRSAAANEAGVQRSAARPAEVERGATPADRVERKPSDRRPRSNNASSRETGESARGNISSDRDNTTSMRESDEGVRLSRAEARVRDNITAAR